MAELTLVEVAANLPEKTLDEMWSNWKDEFGKMYKDNREELRRYRYSHTDSLIFVLLQQ